MKYRTILFLLLAIALLSACSEQAIENLKINSPNSNISVELDMQNNQLLYSVYFNNQKIITQSKLGYRFQNQTSLDSNLVIIDYKRDSINENWEQVWGQQKIVNNNYNELKVYLQEINQPNRNINIVFRAFNDGIAFRYEIPENNTDDSLYISNELTEFNFIHDYKAWYIPANFDSYEALYLNKHLSEVESANTPITIEAGDSCFVSIHEANLTNYAGMTIKSDSLIDFSFHCDLVPWPDSIKVKTKLPMQSPWRTIQIAPTASELITSSLILNLNEPNCLEDVSWIKPMKYIGIWWGMHLGSNTWTEGEKHGATTENMKQYIDFAAENNIPAVLAEGWNTGWDKWGQKGAFDYVTPYPDYSLDTIVAYAKLKNIELIGHHETGGDIISYEENLENAFKMLKKLNIHALKTGYAGPINPEKQYHHGQYMVNHYRKVVETAAKYQIMIDAHEPIKPTGICRTYPNMMTREGARGMEWNAWSEGNPPEHHVILPFTRILAGPLDYTPGIFDLLYKNTKNREKWNSLDTGSNRIHTTLSKQLALFVVFYSPMQMASDLVANYEDNNAFQFIRDVPVDWEFTKVLNAKIGDYITIARKDIGSDDWYMGSITDENEREFSLTLDFLDNDRTYIAEIYSDTEDSHWDTNPYPYEIIKLKVSSKTRLDIKLAAGGGQAIRFEALK